MVHEIKPGVCYRDTWTSEDYDEAIEALINAKKQRESIARGEPQWACEICSDTGHTAGQCHHEPLWLARQWTAATTVYVCYHCGLECKNDEEAKEHFGKNEYELVKCQQIIEAAKSLMCDPYETRKKYPHNSVISIVLTGEVYDKLANLL